MAISRIDSVKVSDIIPGADDTVINVQTVRRVIGFPRISREAISVTVETTRGGVVDSQTITFGADPQPADPPADITDDNGNVLVPAGFYEPAIPSIDQLRDMDINGATLGDVVDNLKTMVYLLAQALNPDWAGEQV